MDSPSLEWSDITPEALALKTNQDLVKQGVVETRSSASGKPQWRIRQEASASDRAIQNIGGIAAEALQQYVERIERLEEEKRALSEDIKQVLAEAKSTGFDTKIIRAIVKLRRIEEHDRKEQEELLDLYKAALGMV